MDKVSCVLFDLGGVIVNWNNSWLIDEVSNMFRISKNDLSREFINNLPNLSSGKIDEKEFWSNVFNKINSPELIIPNSLLEMIFRKYMSINESVVALSKELKESGITLGILSNTEAITYSTIKKLTSLDHFEFKFLSYEIGYVKPDSRIYRHVIDRIPFATEELFFIDDLAPNVESARKLGIKSFHFSNYEKLYEELRKYQIL